MLTATSRKPARARLVKAGAPAVLLPKRASKRDAVLAEAALQFNARGISGTALNDIATKLELTRAALYYYVDDRDDLVFQTYLRSCEITADDLEAAYESGRNGLQRILAYVEGALDAERRAGGGAERGHVSDRLAARDGREGAAAESWRRCSASSAKGLPTRAFARAIPISSRRR